MHSGRMDLNYTKKTMFLSKQERQRLNSKVFRLNSKITLPVLPELLSTNFKQSTSEDYQKANRHTAVTIYNQTLLLVTSQTV